MEYTSPTFWDIAATATNTTCSNNDSIGTDESDSVAAVNTTANHYCKHLDFDGSSNYNLDQSNTDPDVCETNSNATSTNPAWRFDTSSTNDFTSITCFISDSKVGCTYPNALNYNPNATYNDGSCFYDSWSGGGSGTWSTDVTVNIDGWDGINKEIFDIETIQAVFNMQALLMFFLVFFKFFSRII